MQDEYTDAGREAQEETLVVVKKAKAKFSRQAFYDRAVEQNSTDRANASAKRKAERAPEARRIALKKGALRAAAHRARKADMRAAGKAAEPVRVIPEPLSKEVLQRASVMLWNWLKQPGRRQRMIEVKGDKTRYMRGQRVLLLMRHELGAKPSPAAFAAELEERNVMTINRNSALYLLNQLTEIEQATGPWIESVTAAGETSGAA